MTRRTKSGRVNHSLELLFNRFLRAIDSWRAPVILGTRERLLQNDPGTRSPVVPASGLFASPGLVAALPLWLSARPKQKP